MPEEGGGPDPGGACDGRHRDVDALGGEDHAGGGEALERAWTVVRLRRGAEVADAELVHELRDERRTLIAHELLPASELVAAGAPVEAP